MPTAPTGYPSRFAQLNHALELRREGMTYQQIADRVGLARPEQAQKLISKAIRTVLRETAEEVRSIELSRFEMLINLLWPQMLKDIEGPMPDFRRFDRVKSLIESKLKFCGAQTVIEGDDTHFTQIIINKFTSGSELPAPPIHVNGPLKPLEAKDVEGQRTSSGMEAEASPNGGMGRHGAGGSKYTPGDAQEMGQG